MILLASQSGKPLLPHSENVDAKSRCMLAFALRLHFKISYCSINAVYFTEFQNEKDSQRNETLACYGEGM